jgi:hypothetical protein
VKGLGMSLKTSLMVLSGVAGVCLSTPAFALSAEDRRTATTLQGTAEIFAFEDSKRGKIEGCGLGFRAFGFDAVSPGEPAFIVTGSFAIRFVDDPPMLFILMKIGVDDIESFDPPKAVRWRPAFAYLQDADGKTMPEKFATELVDDDGSLVASWKVTEENTDVLMKALGDRKITLGFNRTADGRDLKIDLDLMVINSSVDQTTAQIVRKRDPSELLKYMACHHKLLLQAQERLPKN